MSTAAAGLTDPELAALVYICNSSIKAYDVITGSAVPSSHSLPDSKLPNVPEYAGFAAASKLFSFRTPQAAQAAKAAQAGEDPEEIAVEYTEATRAAAAAAAAAKAGDAQPDSLSQGNKQDQNGKAARSSAGQSAAAAAADGSAHAEADAAAAAGGEGSGEPKKRKSFRASLEQVVNEEALEEEMDDTLRTASSGPDGSESHTLTALSVSPAFSGS